MRGISGIAGGLGPRVWPEDLPVDAAAACKALVAEQAAVRVAEARRIVLVAHWLDLHAPVEHPDAPDNGPNTPGVTVGRVLPGTERYVPAGADGTPLVAEFACAELGAMLGMHPAGARAFQAKVANLRHRHPLLDARVRRGEVEGWKALETARLIGRSELALTKAQAHWIDDRSHEWITTLPWGAYLQLLEQLIIDVDPTGAQHRADAAATRQGVWTTKSTDEGLKTMVARASAGEITYLIAVVDRLAGILAEKGDTRPLEPRRAAALALLAHPAHALALLADHAADNAHDNADNADADGDNDNGDPDAGDTDDTDDELGDNADADGADAAGNGRRGLAPADADSDADEDGGAVGGADDAGGDQPGTLALFGTADADADPEGPEGAEGAEGAEDVEGGVPAGGMPRRGQWSFLTVPDDLAAALRLLAKPGVLDKLMPTATLYVHVDQAAVHTNTGPATVEGLGVVTADQARRWLGHRRVTITPVVDLNAEHAPVEGYVFPTRLRQVMHLTNPRDNFPYGTAGAAGGAGKDADHVKPYAWPGTYTDEYGPPAQTGLHNGSLLGRFAHRLKTHGRWRLQQLDRGVYLWHSPHGMSYLVDPLGTHPVPHAVLPWLLKAAHLDDGSGNTNSAPDGAAGDPGRADSNAA